MTKKHPSNAIIAVVVAIAVLFGLYIAGNLLLGVREDTQPGLDDEELQEDPGLGVEDNLSDRVLPYHSEYHAKHR